MAVTTDAPPSTPLAYLLALAEKRVPARVRPFVEQARRDATTLASALLLGKRPAPLVARKPRPASKATVTVETAAASSVVAKVEAQAARSFGVTVLDDGAEHTLRANADQFLLEAVLESGASVPFSCTLGGCGSCRVKLERGDIALEEPHCLTPEELEAGYRLLCVGRATADCVVRVERDE